MAGKKDDTEDESYKKDSVCPSGRYGRECENTCNCAGGTECLVTGGCSAGCAAGYHGETCNEICDLGKYGKDCSQDCSANCKLHGTEAGLSPCDHISGICTSGCQNGYHGPMCVTPADDDSTGIMIGLGVGVAVLVILLVVGAVFSVYCYRRRLRAAGVSGQRGRPGYDDVERTRQDDHTYHTTYISEDGYDLPRNVTVDETTGNQDRRTRSTAQYEDADVGRYESVIIRYNAKDDATEHNVQNQPADLTEANDNNAYINVAF